MSLSHKTLRRVTKLSDNVTLQLKKVVQQCKYFFLVVDKRTDISDISQFLVFVHTVGSNLTVGKELICLLYGLQKVAIYMYITALCLLLMLMGVLRIEHML